MSNLLRIARSNIERIELIGGKKAKTLSQAVAQFDDKPDYVFNATHFDNLASSKTYGVTISDTVIDKKWVNGGNDAFQPEIYSTEGIAFDKDGDNLVFIDRDSECPDKKGEALHDFYIGGSPVLIDDGKIIEGNTNSSFANGKAYRIGMGFNDGELVVYYSNKRMTLKQLAQELLKAGCDYAIALDGGGSLNVQKYEDGTYKHLDDLKFNRPVSTFVCVWTKKYKNSPEQNDGVVNTFEGMTAIGVMEVKWDSVNRRSCSNSNSALAGQPLKKGDRITVFKKSGSWVYSYGYWVSTNALKWVKFFQ